ncbi:ATP-binding protein [Streptomyces sp. 21So2-11]|uniref:ATP-binding protein n=1 Tax=Streptomyces sp. 21So2-11 TaxID=3144408 RepID=UPI00321A9ADC
MQFAPRPACARLARSQVGRALAGWGFYREASENALLIVSELANNAIQHAKVPGRLFEVKVAVDSSGTCTIEVSDPTKGLLLHTNPLPEDEFGRGCSSSARSPTNSTYATGWWAKRFAPCSPVVGSGAVVRVPGSGFGRANSYSVRH